MNQTGKITGLGYCGQDYLSIVPYIPVDDKVEIINSLIQGGGPAATAIYAAAKLGAETAFISNVGDDAAGATIIAELEGIGIDCSQIIQRTGQISPTAYCWVADGTGKRSIAWTKGTAGSLSVDEVNAEYIKDADILHLDGHHTDAAIAAARIARDNGVKVVIDAGTILPRIDELLDLSDVIIASEKFAQNFTGLEEPKEALKKMFTKNTRWAVITIGNKGSIGYDGKEFIFCPPLPAEVVDTTGAGDVYHGGFIYKYLECDDLAQIMRFATGAAAIKCTKFGGRTGIPDLETLEKYLEKN